METSDTKLQDAILQIEDLLSNGVARNTRKHDESLFGSHALRDAIDQYLIYSVTDISGKIVDVNDRFCEISGYSREELLGKSHRILKSDVHTRSFWVDMWKTISSGNTWHGEVCNQNKDGSYYWVDSTNIPWFNSDGKVERYVSLRIDITEKKLAEKERDRLLSESVELAKIIRESPDELYIAECESAKFLAVNHGACNSTGFSESELLSMTVYDLNPEYDSDRLEKLVRPLLSGEISNLELQTTHRKKNSEAYPVRISIHRSIYQGIPVFVAFASDLTKVRKLEQSLAQAQKLEAIGQLSAGVAHEINTPMQFIGDNIEFLDEHFEKILSFIDTCEQMLFCEEPIEWEERKNKVIGTLKDSKFKHLRNEFPIAIKESLEGIHRTKSILKAMKDFSHPGTDELNSVDVNQAIHSTVSITRNRWKHHADIKLQLESDLPLISGYAAEINQALLNLVVNAGDALLDEYANTGELGIISIRTWKMGDFIEIEIEDNGCGMPEEVRRKAFDPFFTTKDVGKGTGQGLALCHNVIVNMHNGTIDVTSEKDVGTIFTISLPINPEDYAEDVLREANTVASAQ